MITEFPQELLDATIDCLDPSDYHRTALVAKSWLSRSQSHLLRKISLGVALQGGYADGLVEIPPFLGDFNNFQAFEELLHGSPHLAQYMRNLEMGLPAPSAELQGVLANFEPLSEAAWQAIGDVVAGFLPKLFRLESLALFPCGPAAFHSFHLPGRLSNLFMDHNLKSLSLCQWRLPSCPSLSIFQPSLSSLRFINCEFGNSTEPSQPSARMVSLTTLELDLCIGVELFQRYWLPQHRWHVDDMTIRFSDYREAAIRALQSLALAVTQKLNIIFSGNPHSQDPSVFFQGSCFSHIPKLHLTFNANNMLRATLLAWCEAGMRSIQLRLGMTLSISFIISFSHHGSSNFIATTNDLQALNPTLRFKTRTICFDSFGHDAYLTLTYICVEDQDL
ncbi:hypothetical protein C8R45DRAFT_1107973 [Mycena sanguinolenta]|nr:hypothetical protein C8R45DRAFT_1107973 [Mycena sanguinolenta]